MPVHFDFIVDDEEAQTIMEAIQDCEVEAVERLCGTARTFEERPLGTGEKEWWTGRKHYIRKLIKKMKNRRIVYSL